MELVCQGLQSLGKCPWLGHIFWQPLIGSEIKSLSRWLHSVVYFFVKCLMVVGFLNKSQLHDALIMLMMHVPIILYCFHRPKDIRQIPLGPTIDPQFQPVSGPKVRSSWIFLVMNWWEEERYIWYIYICDNNNNHSCTMGMIYGWKMIISVDSSWIECVITIT
jgi:hypothetical protein